MENPLTETDLNEFVLANMPHFIAVNYQRLLAAQTPQEQVELALHIYNLGLRILTIGLVSQYLIRDKDKVSDPYLNELLLQKFPRLTLDAWQQLLFASLRAYEGNRDLFFMPEMYDFYWDTSTVPHRCRAEIEQPFNRLTQLTIEKQTNRLLPQTTAEWERLAVETMDLLQQILRHVTFISRYELIRVLHYEEQFYEFELHKGLTISIGRQASPRSIQFNRGWFYLRKETAEFLLLHPLLVFWEDETAKSELMLAAIETGVYDRFIYERLQYMLALSGKMVLDDRRVKAFVRLLYDTIEEAKRQRQEADKLTWWQLRDLCAEITQKRMGTVCDKYHPELYLPRDKTSQALAQFLDSDKRCFVLIGKSGVGKSNFLLALGEALPQSRSDLCLLMYDGAHLGVAASVTEVISQDFDNRLILAGRRVQQIWQEIAQIDGIEQRRVILCVDAVNESQQAKALLRQLDDLVQSPWPWLKIIFSSRPETWQAIKRGVKLTEALYYREDGAETLGVELEPFSYSEQMEPFSRQELPQAYDKYRQAFKLTTPYEALSPALRDMLRDPLNLWLVAKTYDGQAIPAALKTTELIAQYVDALLHTERLREADLRLLEKQLVPLMVSQGHYRNAITIADIDAAGGGLYEAIYSEQLLSDGQRMNQSFTNLLDADILTRQTQGRNQNITFKYERFYEYFVGKVLFKDLGPKDTWKKQYGEWITELFNTPYLWGAVKSCLEQQMQELPAEECAMFCIELARIGNQRLEEIIITALAEYGRDESEKVQNIIKRMLEQERGWLRATLKKETVAKQCPAWKRVSINAASNLKMGKLVKFALTDPSSAVRAVALRYAFIYWRQERKAGFQMLENLMDRSIGFLGLPIPYIFESFVGFSLLILFDDFANPETTDRLRQIWRRGIERLMKVNPNQLGSKNERIKSWISSALLRIVTGFVVRIASEIPSNSPRSIPELRGFFRYNSGLARRQTAIHTLVQFLDVATDVREIQNELLDLAGERDMMITLLAGMVLQRHFISHPEAAIPLIKDLFDKAISVNPPGPFSIIPFLAVFSEAEYSTENSRALARYMIITHLDRFQGKWRTNLYEHRSFHLDMLTFAEIGDAEDVPLSPAARQYLEKIITDRDYAWLKDFIEYEVTTRAVAGYTRFALSALEILARVPESTVKETVIESLARIRIYYPDEVDDFVVVNNFDEQLISTIMTHAPSETIGDLLNLKMVIFWNETIVFKGSPEFWRKLIWLWEQVLECHSLEQWLTILFKFVINEIYGEPIFVEIKV